MRNRHSIRLWLDRTISGGIWKQVLVAFVLFGIVFVILGIAYSVSLQRCAFNQTFADMSSPISLRSILYDTENKGLQFPHNWLVWSAYILGTILLSGVLIATITNGLRTRSDRFRKGDVRYRFRGHIVFLGYDDMVIGMIKRLCVKTQSRIVVAVAGDAAKCYDMLYPSLDKQERRRVVVLRANRCNRVDLRRLRVGKASAVYIIGEPGEETRDTLNMNSFNEISKLCPKTMPECYVNISHQSTFALFQTYAGSGDKQFDAALAHFHSFNFYNEWARLMVTGEYSGLNSSSHIDSRTGDSICDHPEKQVHLVIVGMTQMGEALAREAAFVCHYPGYLKCGTKTRITFIDKAARERMTSSVSQYHHLFDHCCYTFQNLNSGVGAVEEHKPKAEKDFLDIEFEFIESNVESPSVRDKFVEWAADTKQYLTLAICFESSHHGIATALYLPDAVVENNIPIWVYQSAQGDLASYLKGSKFSNVVAFGMSGEEIPNRFDSEDIVCAQRLNHFYLHLKDTEVDYSNKEIIRGEWKSSLVFDRWSSLYNVAAIPVKLKGIGGIDKLKNRIEDVARVEHNRWNVEKLLMGFRATTPEEHARVLTLGKDEKKRMKKHLFAHDDIRPFDDLPDDVAIIDRRMSREIPKLIGRVN